MPWEHEPQASVSTAFSSSPKLSQVFLSLDRNTENMFSISFRKHRHGKKRKQLVNFDYQNVNSLCSCHQRVLVLCFYRVIETRFLANQRAYFLRTVF